MDGLRFDELTKGLATASSRRRVIAGLLGSALGLMGGAFGRRGAGADAAKRCNKTCPPGAVLAAGCRCICEQTGRRPVDGICPCPDGRAPCAGVCCESGKICVDAGDTIGEICADEDVTVTAAPEVVWRALTDADVLAAWALPNDVAPAVGQRFRLWTPRGDDGEGVLEGEIVALDAPRRVAFIWRGGGLDTPAKATIILDPVDGGARTRLRLVNESGPAACRAAARLLGSQWQRAFFAEALPRYLAEN